MVDSKIGLSTGRRSVLIDLILVLGYADEFTYSLEFIHSIQNLCDGTVRMEKDIETIKF